MADSTGLQFTVKVGTLPESTLVVAEFALDEGLNRPFNLRLELASSQPDIDFGAVLDQPCELLVWYNGELQRRVCGVVSDFAQGDSGFRRTRYQLLVQPALWRLSLRQNSRIFQAQKPDEILSILLQEHGITDYAFALKNEHVQREYCVQYRETDLDFVNRLAAEEGLFYFHEFEQGKHRIVFADDAAALTAGPELFFNLGNRSLEQGPYVRQFHYHEAVRPSDVELKDYSFKTPAYGLSHKKVGAELAHQRDTYQHFDYPGRYKLDPSGKAFAQHRLDALRNDAVTGSGKSNCAALLPGQTFSLTEHPNGSLNTDWQIVHIRHTGEQPQALEALPTDSVSIPDKAVIELVSFHDRKRYRIKVDLPTDLEQKMRQVYLVEGRHDRRNRLYFGLAPGGYFEVMLTGGGLQLSPDLLLARGIAEVVTDDWYDQRVPIARQYGMDDFDKKYGALFKQYPVPSGMDWASHHGCLSCQGA